MPQLLTDAQKEIIRSATTDLIDLPEEESLLLPALTLLKQALETEPLEEAHDYALLQKCLLDPTAWFRRLEDFNANITIGSVQEYLLEFINEKIETAAQAANTPLERLPWNSDSILHRLEQSEDFAEPFITQQLAFYTGEHPWQIPVDSGKLFSAEFIQQRELRRLDIKITIKLPGWQPLQGAPIAYPDYIATDEHEDDFIYDQKSLASKQVEETVTPIILNYLVSHQALSLGQKHRASQGAKKLLMYHYYFEAVLDRSLDFNDLSQVGLKQVELLADPAIRSLIAAGKCSIAAAKNTTPEERNLIQNPYYLNELIEGRLELRDIKGVTKSQRRMLVLPGIIYLQKKEKISFKAAKVLRQEMDCLFKSEHSLQLFMTDKLLLTDLKKLKAHEALLLSDSYYSGEFAKGNFSLSLIKKLFPRNIDNLLTPALIELQKKIHLPLIEAAFISEDGRRVMEEELYLGLTLKDPTLFPLVNNLKRAQVDTLLHPKIKKLIEAGVFTPQQALELSDKQKELCFKNRIHALLLAKRIFLNDVQEMSLELANFINGNFCFYGLLYRGAFQLEDCKKALGHRELFSNPLSRWGLIFSCRLMGIYKNLPSANKHLADEIQSIREDLHQVIEQDPSLSHSAIMDEAIRIFLRYLQNEIRQETKNNPSNASAYILFLYKLAAIKRSHSLHTLSSLSVLHQMAALAKKQSEDFSTNPELAFGKRAKISFSFFQSPEKQEALGKIHLFQQKIASVISLAQVNKSGSEYSMRCLGA